MKTILIALLSLMMSLTACSDGGVYIQYDRLPEVSRSFIDEHFSDLTPLVVMLDLTEYEVIFKSGEKIEFDRRGNWKEVNCRVKAVPSDIVPRQILSLVRTIYPESFIIKIEREAYGYNVKLNKRIELEFNKNFKLVNLDALI